MQTSGIGFKRNLGVGTIPVYQRDKAFTLVQGGFNLDKTGLVAGQLLKGGTPAIFDEATRLLVVGRFGSLYTAASNSATTYQVAKGSGFKVGDNLSAAKGGTAYPITAIDTSNANYDVLTVGTTLGTAYQPGQLLFASTATGTTASALPAFNCLLYEDLIVDPAINQFVGPVIRATVYARRVPYSTDIAAIPALDDIIYSQSY